SARRTWGVGAGTLAPGTGQAAAVRAGSPRMVRSLGGADARWRPLGRCPLLEWSVRRDPALAGVERCGPGAHARLGAHPRAERAARSRGAAARDVDRAPEPVAGRARGAGVRARGPNRRAVDL